MEGTKERKAYIAVSSEFEFQLYGLLETFKTPCYHQRPAQPTRKMQILVTNRLSLAPEPVPPGTRRSLPPGYLSSFVWRCSIYFRSRCLPTRRRPHLRTQSHN